MFSEEELHLINNEKEECYLMYEHYLPYFKNLDPKKTNVLDICSGLGLESIVLKESFNFENIVCMDVIDYTSKSLELGVEVFVPDDILNFSKYISKVDLLIGRNVPIKTTNTLGDFFGKYGAKFYEVFEGLEREEKYWGEFYSKLLNQNPNLNLFLTFLRKDELDSTLYLLKEFNFLPIINQENPFTITNYTHLGSSIIDSDRKDRYVLLGRFN